MTESSAESQFPEILLVEDNEIDVLFTLNAFKSAKLVNRIQVVRDGAEALQFLRREGKFAEAQRPGIILLDINLPKKSGHEVLSEIRKTPDLASIPIIMLTSSSSVDNVSKAYEHNADLYLIKPILFEDFLRIVGKISDFGCGITFARTKQETPDWLKKRAD